MNDAIAAIIGSFETIIKVIKIIFKYFTIFKGYNCIICIYCDSKSNKIVTNVSAIEGIKIKELYLYLSYFSKPIKTEKHREGLFVKNFDNLPIIQQLRTKIKTNKFRIWKTKIENTIRWDIDLPGIIEWESGKITTNIKFQAIDFHKNQNQYTGRITMRQLSNTTSPIPIKITWKTSENEIILKGTLLKISSNTCCSGPHTYKVEECRIIQFSHKQQTDKK